MWIASFVVPFEEFEELNELCDNELTKSLDISYEYSTMAEDLGMLRKRAVLERILLFMFLHAL